MSAKRMCPKCGNGCDDTMLVCPKCGMSLSSIHRPEIDKRSQGNKKTGKVRSFSAPSGEAGGTKEHKNKPTRLEPVEGRSGQQAVASATGSMDKTHRKPSLTPYEENAPEVKQKSAPTEEQKRNSPVARGLIRQHMDEVELDLPEETQESSSPAPVPATETVQNVPAAPYPVVYLTMKSTDGTDVQVPYLNTPNGLVPWITQAPQQQMPAQMSEAKRTVEEGNVVPLVPQVKSHVSQNYNETKQAEPDSEQDSYKEDGSGYDDGHQEDEAPDDVSDDKFSYDDPEDSYEEEPEYTQDTDEQNALEQGPVSSQKAQTREEQLDEEDDEAFRKAMKVSSKKSDAAPEKGKKSLKDKLPRMEKRKQENTKKDKEQTNEPETKTVFHGFDPNEDHYYDDRKPVYAAEKDHITKDFILRVVGAFAIVIGLTIAMIYMV